MIPLFSNMGYSEINSPGDLSVAMGTDKTKLPLQYFKLTGNVTGNLTMPSNVAHKKIFLDTNGFDIVNPNGSPLTTNASVPMVIKGSGNIQSALITTNKSVTSTSNTGTTTFDNSDSSTVVVDTGFTFDEDVTSFSGQQTTGYGVNGFFNTTFAGWLGGNLLTNITSDFRMQFNDAFIEDNPKGGGLIVGTGGASIQSNYTSTGGRSFPPIEPSSNTVTNGYRTITWAGAGYDPRAGGSSNNYTITIRIADSMTGTPHIGKARVMITTPNNYRYILPAGGVIPNAITTTGIRMVYTNNLTIPIVLSGADPFNNVSVTAGGNSTANISSSDGSFDITGTITGSNGSGQPYALSYVNDGTGQLDITDYTGVNSVSAF